MKLTHTDLLFILTIAAIIGYGLVSLGRSLGRQSALVDCAHAHRIRNHSGRTFTPGHARPGAATPTREFSRPHLGGPHVR